MDATSVDWPPEFDGKIYRPTVMPDGRLYLCLFRNENTLIVISEQQPDFNACCEACRIMNDAVDEIVRGLIRDGVNKAVNETLGRIAKNN